jgi:hypothetical protein
VLLKRLEAPLDVKGLVPTLALLAEVHIGPEEDVVFLVCDLDRLVKKVFHRSKYRLEDEKNQLFLNAILKTASC